MFTFLPYSIKRCLHCNHVFTCRCYFLNRTLMDYGIKYGIKYRTLGTKGVVYGVSKTVCKHRILLEDIQTRAPAEFFGVVLSWEESGNEWGSDGGETMREKNNLGLIPGVSDYFCPRSVPILSMKPIPTIPMVASPRINSVSMMLGPTYSTKNRGLKGHEWIPLTFSSNFDILSHNLFTCLSCQNCKPRIKLAIVPIRIISVSIIIPW